MNRSNFRTYSSARAQSRRGDNKFDRRPVRGEERDGQTRTAASVRQAAIAGEHRTIIHRDQTFVRLIEPGLTSDFSITATPEEAKPCFRSLF